MKTIAAKVPDTITTWFANGFALSSTDGIGVASPAALRAFQPFFVSLTLPYSVVRGESLKVPATVFNYLKECLAVSCHVNAHYRPNILSHTLSGETLSGETIRWAKFSSPSQKFVTFA